MKYFVPDIRVAAELPPQTTIEDKLGGLPWGLTSADWPKCANCGGSLSLLSQFIHDPGRLDLGREGRTLLVFQCNHAPGECSVWEGGSGANAIFIIEPEAIIEGFTDLPNDSPTIEHEVRVVSWLERDDGVPNGLNAAFFDDDRYLSLPETTREMVTSTTRLGGVPHWMQFPSEAPNGWNFIGQLDSSYSFLTAPMKTAPWISIDAERWEGRSHVGQGPNFGDGGIAYMFLRPAQGVPDAWFFWQCS